MNLTTWQRNVQTFHLALGLESGNYAAPMPLSGARLELRARLLDEEVGELAVAHNRHDLIEIIDALIDLAYITLGAFDVAGMVADSRFMEIIASGSYRHTAPFTIRCSDELRAVESDGRAIVSVMYVEYNRGWAFQRFDLLDDLLKQIARAFTSLRLDPRPFWNEVHRSNLAKAGGPIIQGKQRKPTGWTPPDIAGVLIAQGVEIEDREISHGIQSSQHHNSP